MKKENRGLWILVIVLGIIMLLLMAAIVVAMVCKFGGDSRNSFIPWLRA